ncbi:MAG TPA: osmoprotectant NAGGN system M42 family peptidase [Actinomycetota bacterium]
MSSIRIDSVDLKYVTELLVRLLDTPSPTGRTDTVMRLIGEELGAMGVETELTRRGVLIANLPGEQTTPDRAIVVHADTVGAIVRGIKPNGRLRIAAVGTHPARSVEGARVLIFTDEQERAYTGTILPALASGHAFGEGVDAQPSGWDLLEIRIDERVESAHDTQSLGINIGDHVALESNPRVTDTGYINARHLDGKAGVAAAIGAVKAVVDAHAQLPVSAHLVVTVAEEVGLGAAGAIHADIAESVAIDNAVVAEGQISTETSVTVCMQDSSGPMDYHLSRKLITLAEQLQIPVLRDVFTVYRSDLASALEAGASMRATLIGFGVDASHGHERTHLDGLLGLTQLITAYLQTPLMFSSDEVPMGPVEEFPTQDEPPETGL